MRVSVTLVIWGAVFWIVTVELVSGVPSSMVSFGVQTTYTSSPREVREEASTDPVALPSKEPATYQA
jgi:hypothetical protein